MCLALAVSMTQPTRSSTEGSSDPVILDEHPGKGEQCIVCRKAVHDDLVVTVRLRGRTFHVRADMLETFQEDPERYFRRLQAHGGLFDEGAMPEPRERGSYWWFAFGLYVLVGVVFGAACGGLAVARQQPSWPWFVAGLLFNLFALLALLMQSRGDASSLPSGIPAGLRKIPVTRSPIHCPNCGAAIHPAAKRCSACGLVLSPRVQAETTKVSATSDS